MKLENTLANKMKFIALYWGQSVRLYKDDSVSKSTIKTWDLEHPEDVFLELTPLSQISDDDAIEVAKILDFHDGDGLLISRYNTRIAMYDRYNENPEKQNVLHLYHSILEVFSLDENGKVFQYDFERLIKVYNYLLSRGYYVGDGTEIEYGWVKLKEV